MSFNLVTWRSRSHAILGGRFFQDRHRTRKLCCPSVSSHIQVDVRYFLIGIVSCLFGSSKNNVLTEETSKQHSGRFLDHEYIYGDREQQYRWQLSGPDSVKAFFDNTIGTILAGLSSASLGVVWDLLTPSDQSEINKHIEALDHLGRDIQRCPESDFFREQYVAKTRACAKLILPRIHDMLLNGTDSRGRPLSDHHQEKLRILKCKLQSSLHSISMDSVRGHSALKQDLEECVVWPCLNSGLFKDIRRPPRGILLYGPPGNGKTMMSKALAARVGVPFYQISSCDVVSRYHGDSEKNIRAVCEAARAEPHGAVVFIDEIDSLAPARDGFGIHNCEVKQINELLHQIDGIKMDHDYDKVIYIGATNRPWALDPALLRRLPKKCYLGPPNYDRRLDFVQYVIGECDKSEIRFQLSTEEADQFVRSTNGYSYSALDNLVREAVVEPVREVVKGGIPIAQVKPVDVPPVQLRHLSQASEKIRCDVDEKSLRSFEAWSSIGSKSGSAKPAADENLIAENLRLRAEINRLSSHAFQRSSWFDVAGIEAIRMLPLMAMAWVIANTVRGWETRT